MTSFFPIVDIMFRCRNVFGQTLESVPKSGFMPQPMGYMPRGVRNKFFK